MQLDIYEQGWIFPGNTLYDDDKGAVSIDLLVQIINAASNTEFKWLQHNLIIYEDLNILDGATPLVEDVDYIKGPENNEISAFIAAYRSLPTDSIHVVTGIYIQDTGHLGNDLTVSGKYAGDEISMRDIPNILAKTTVYEINTSSDEVHALPDARLVDNQQIVKRRGDGNGIVTFTTVSSQTIDTLAATELTLEGESSIILIPKSGNWESVKTGGVANLVSGALSTTIAINKLVYFNSNGKLDIGDKGELSKAILAGFLIKAGILDDIRYVQSSGILDGFTGLTEGTQYFLGNTGDIVVKGSIDYNDYIVSVGVAISTTEMDVSIRIPEPTRNQDDGTPISALVKFPVYKDRSNQGYLPYTYDSFSQANYSNLFSEIGHVYNDMHVQAGGTDLSASGTLFYATPVPGYYERGGTEDTAVIDSTTDVDDTTELITLSTTDYDALHMTRGVLGTGADGVPIRLKLVSGALPTGLTVDTTYFVRFKTTPDIELYTDEASAINTAVTTNRVDLTDAVGTFQITQEGIALDDAMQQITGEFGGGRGGVSGGAFTVTGTNAVLTTGSSASNQYGFDSANSPNALTSNETRPKTFISFGYIKAEHVTTSGEPISALRYVKDWSSTSTWTAGNSIIINHNLGVTFDEYKGQIFVRDDAVPNKIYNVTNMEILNPGPFGQRLNGIDGDLNNCFLQIGSDNSLYITDTGTTPAVPVTGWSYKVILTKPNLVATYADTSFRKVYDITDATDYTHTLPDASTQLTEFFIKRRGAGAGVVNFATVLSQTINGNAANTWGLKGESDITLIPVGGNWEVKAMNGFIFNVQDQKTANTDGGSSLVGLNIRDLNTILLNTITGASLSSNQITLPAGVYKIDATAPGFRSNRHYIQLYNTIDTAIEIEGPNHYIVASDYQAGRASLRGIFTISATKVFEIRHYIETVLVGNGLGIGSNTELGNSVERYTDVFLEKIG